jgi:hypothetical protein
VRSVPLVQKILSVATVALLIAGVVAALAHTGGGGSVPAGHNGPGAGRSGPPASSTAAAASTVTSSPARPGATSTTVGQAAPSGGPTTTAAPPPSPHSLPTVGGAAGDPGQPTATAQGTYRYDVSYSGGQSGSSSGTMTEKVTTQATSGGATRQSVTETQSVNPPPQNGQQGSGTEVVQWDTHGLTQLSVQMDAGGQSIDCTWSPPVLELPSGLAVGRRWAFDSTCHVTLFGQPGTVQLSGNATVTGKQVVKVGADQVPVWVVSDVYTLVVHSDRLAMTFTIHHDATDRVSGRLGLLVEEDATTTMGSGTTVSHQELQSIHPS